MSNKPKPPSNAKAVNWPDLERLNIYIETLTDKATKVYINNLMTGINEMKAKSEVVPVAEYGAALHAVNEQLKIICKRNKIADAQIANRMNRSQGWLSECSLPPDHSRARSTEATQRRLYNIVQARKNALFALFTSRKWDGVDADEFVQGARAGELDV